MAHLEDKIDRLASLVDHFVSTSSGPCAQVQARVHAPAPAPARAFVNSPTHSFSPLFSSLPSSSSDPSQAAKKYSPETEKAVALYQYMKRREVHPATVSSPFNVESALNEAAHEVLSSQSRGGDRIQNIFVVHPSSIADIASGSAPRRRRRNLPLADVFGSGMMPSCFSPFYDD
jgi:hypothetical protein